MPPAQPSIPASVLQTILDFPAGAAPSGQTSNVNAENPFHIVTVVLAIVFITVPGIFVAVRLVTQHFLSKGLALEDYIITAAWLVQLATFIITILNRRYVGQHIWNITIGDAMGVLKAFNTVSILYAIAIGLIKIAIMVQYLRLFTSRQINRPLRIACWIWIAVNALFYTVDMLLEIMQCLPREKIWNPIYPGPGHCLSLYDIWVGTGIFNTISDFVILLLPIPAIARLHLQTRKKLFIIAIFATGFIACVASAIRTYYTWLTLRASDTDQTYWMEYVGIWIWIEMCIGFVVFCLPTAPQFCFFVGTKTRSLYGVLSSRSSSLSSSLSRKGSWPAAGAKTASSSSSEAAAEKSTSISAAAPPRLTLTNVSFASFEPRFWAAGKGEEGEMDRDIYVERSVSQVVERVGEGEKGRLEKV